MGIDLDGLKRVYAASQDKPLGDREALVRMVKVWAGDNGVYLSDAWRKLYAAFCEEYHVVLSKPEKGAPYLDQIEGMGLMGQLREFAVKKLKTSPR